MIILERFFFKLVFYASSVESLVKVKVINIFEMFKFTSNWAVIICRYCSISLYLYIYNSTTRSFDNIKCYE